MQHYGKVKGAPLSSVNMSEGRKVRAGLAGTDFSGSVDGENSTKTATDSTQLHHVRAPLTF